MAEPIRTKTCRICKQTKPLIEFCKNRLSASGYEHRCKNCRNKWSKKYRQSKKGKDYRENYQTHYQQTEKGKAAHRKACLRYNRTEKGRIAQKRQRKSEKYKATQKRYNQSEKGKAAIKRKIHKHHNKNPEKYKARTAVNNAISTGILPQIDTMQCHYCPSQAVHYHHHKGYAPKHWLDVIPVCIKCHLSQKLKN